VLPVNQTPVWSGTFSASYQVDVYSTLSIPMAAYSDPDTADTLTATCKVSGVTPSWISSCTATTIFVTGHTNAQAGIYTVSVQVTDDDYYHSGTTYTISKSFSLTIVSVNRAPTWSTSFVN
jgi:hypothetical protein